MFDMFFFETVTLQVIALCLQNFARIIFIRSAHECICFFKGYLIIGYPNNSCRLYCYVPQEESTCIYKRGLKGAPRSDLN